MDIEKQLTLSYYEQIAIINNSHKIYLVQHRETKKIYVKKVMDIYNKDVYMHLLTNPIVGTPHIKEAIECDDELVVIEEYISGDSLEELLLTKKFVKNEIVDIICQLCSIVKNIHKVKPSIVHRDIKPSNIIITNDGRVILIDFNAAKYIDKDKEEDTRLLGTKGYAAPEQYGFGTSDVRTDIYALGMLMNTMCLGHFSMAVTEDRFFSKIINKCINMNPDKRYQSVEKLEKDLIVKEKTKKIDVSQQDVPNVPSWAKYLPIGFRSLDILHIETAIVMYVTLLWVFVGVTFNDVSYLATIIIRVVLIVAFFVYLLINGNYLNYQKYIPVLNSKKWFVRLFALIGIDLIFAMAVFIIMLVIAAIF